MFFFRSTIDINGFSIVFPNSGAMVSDGFDLEKDPKNKNARNRDGSYFATIVRIIFDLDERPGVKMSPL